MPTKHVLKACSYLDPVGVGTFKNWAPMRFWEWMMDSKFYISFSLESWSPGEHLLPHISTPVCPMMCCFISGPEAMMLSTQHCPHCEPKETPSLGLWCVVQ